MYPGVGMVQALGTPSKSRAVMVQSLTEFELDMIRMCEHLDDAAWDFLIKLLTA